MLFGCLGSLPLGGFPEFIASPTGSAYQYLRKSGKLEQFAPPSKEDILAKDRLLWLERARTKRAENAAEEERRQVRQDETRDRNLAMAQIARHENIEKRKETEEQRFENLEKARQALDQVKIWGKPPPDTFRSVWKENMATTKQEQIEKKRLESLELAREAAKEKREREAVIKSQRLENLKKGRKKKK